jgi:hypothetical protein
LERKQVEKKAREKKKKEEEVEITVKAKEKEEDGKAENVEEEKGDNEKEGKADKRGWLCIPKMMRCQILHAAHDIPARGHFGVDQSFLPMRAWDFWEQMFCNTPCYIAGYNICHRTNHRSWKPMGLLQPLSVAEGY